MEENQKKYFPFFVDITGKKVLIVGAGTVAARRADALLRFGANVTAAAPDISLGMQKLQQTYGVGQLHLLRQPFAAGMTAGFELVLAATDDRAVNRQIWEECREAHIFVNVASDPELCDFRFPALVEEEDIVAGINSAGNDHRKVRRISAKIRECLKADAATSISK